MLPLSTCDNMTRCAFDRPIVARFDARGTDVATVGSIAESRRSLADGFVGVSGGGSAVSVVRFVAIPVAEETKRRGWCLCNDLRAKSSKSEI
jgi:hypothetical protein